MKTIATAILALSVLAGAAHARNPQDIFTDIARTAPKSLFDTLAESAPRSLFDQIQDTAPRSIFDDIRDSAPRSDGVFGQLQRNAP